MTEIDNNFLENIMIKASMTDKSYLLMVSNTFEKDYFNNNIVAEIFDFLKKHVEEYNEIPSKDIIINSVKGSKNTIAEADAIDFDIPKNYDYLIKQTNNYLKEQALKCAVMQSANILVNDKENNLQIRDLIDKALTKDLIPSLGLNYFKDLQSRLQRILSNTDKRVPTYFPQLDEYINGGFPPYTLSVIVSKIHGFKSNFLSNMSARQVLHGFNPVLLTLEMSEDAFAQRFDSLFTGLDINKIYNVKSVTNDMIKKLNDVKKREGLGSLFIKQYPTGQATINDFNIYLRELTIRGIKPSIVLVDYINLMKSISSSTDMYTRVKSITEELRALSYKYDCPIVSVSQLNREGMFTSFDEIDFSYIGESLGIAATADAVFIFGKDEDRMLYESELLYKITKNRLGGRVGTIGKFYYDTRNLQMYDETEMDLWINEATVSGDERNHLQHSNEEQPQPGRRKKK